MLKKDLVWWEDGVMSLEEGEGESFSGELVAWGIDIDEENWRILMCTTSACAKANWVWRASIWCCNDDIAPTQPYTGSRTLAFAS